MRDNDNTILDAIKGHVDRIRKNVAQAIKDVDVPTLARYGGIGFIALLIVIALAVGVLALVWKVLGTLLGKVFAVPLFLLIFGLAVTEQRKPRTGGRETDPEQVYEYVLNALFLVIRAVSEYSNIIMPSRPSAIELTDEPYTIENGYVVYNFLAKTCGPIDTAQLRRDMTRTIRQMHQAHEFNGIPRDLVQINGAWYCPLQILGKPQDFGEYVQVSVVFATEKTIELTRAQKLLNLDNIGHSLQDNLCILQERHGNSGSENAAFDTQRCRNSSEKAEIVLVNSRILWYNLYIGFGCHFKEAIDYVAVR